MRSSAGARGFLVALVPLLLATACASPGATGSPSAGTSAIVAQPSASDVGSSSPASTEMATAATAGLHVAFVSFSDGASVPISYDAAGHVVVVVQIRVSGGVGLAVDLTADGARAMDVGGHPLNVTNTARSDPFTATFEWPPVYGGGEYSLIATALDDNKQKSQATAHITVTGVPRTTLPPAMTRQAALAQWNAAMTKAGVSIPSPSMQRFDFPENPTRSQWVVAAYYKGMRYYGVFFDDGHAEWSNGAYSDPSHRPDNVGIAWCRPAGNYKVLVVFVDYGNTGTIKADALAKVPVVVDWLNGMYAKFAKANGSSSALMTITADAAFVAAPPNPGELLTAPQIKAASGKDVGAFDFIIQIDLDVNATFSTKNYKGLVGPGGGLAMHDCETALKSGPINIWSSVTDATNVQGGLVMDLDHELSHMFGMMDDWPFTLGVAGPGDTTIDDWIPYVMFGWTDTDGDGVPEIIDSTPYGTSGPRP